MPDKQKEAVIVYGRQDGKGFAEVQEREVDRSAGSIAVEQKAKADEAAAKPAAKKSEAKS